MLEFIVIIACLGAIILGLIVAIPVMVKLHTDADANPDHIYNIFIRESGTRGIHISSVFLVTLPLLLMANPPTEYLYTLLFLLFSVMAFFFHLPVYQGYKVLNNKMRNILL